MTKVLLILSAVVMAVACFFAYNNGQQFTAVRKAAIEVNRKVEAERLKVLEVGGKITAVNGDIARVQVEVDTESEKKKAQQLRIAQAEAESKRVAEGLKVKQDKLAELRVKLDKLPKGVKIETLVEDINSIKKNIAELGSQAEAKKKEVEAEEVKVVEARKALEDIVRKIEERKKSFDRNSLAAHIVAVNTDWGFVVVDAGQTKGITEATKLLVTRGTQVIGKLSIVSVQGNRTVANILPETITKGMSISPGDGVILENLYQ